MICNPSAALSAEVLCNQFYENDESLFADDGHESPISLDVPVLSVLNVSVPVSVSNKNIKEHKIDSISPVSQEDEEEGSDSDGKGGFGLPAIEAEENAKEPMFKCFGVWREMIFPDSYGSKMNRVMVADEAFPHAFYANFYRGNWKKFWNGKWSDFNAEESRRLEPFIKFNKRGLEFRLLTDILLSK
jgi:hypothetical protein